MRYRPLQHRWGIRQRVLFLAVIPMFLVSITIGFYLTWAHLSYMRQSLEDHGSMIARNLALASEFSLVIDDRARLDKLVQRAHFRPEVIAIIIYDAQGVVLAENIHVKGGGKDFDRSSRHVQAFSADVYSTPLAGGESEELSGPRDNERLGRVVVYISRDQFRERAWEILLRSVLFILSGLLISSLFAILMARELLMPIQRIINLVGRVQRGDLSSRLARKSGAEFGELEQGINRMVKTIEGSQKELESRVESATGKLQDTVAALQQKNIALEESRLEAVEANQAKERFLAHVSHELRTPLNAIVGFAELLENTSQDQEQTEYVQIINNASQQLLAVINDVLSFSELRAGKLKIAIEYFNPETVLEDVVSLLSREAHRKGLELVLLIHRDTPRRVMGDPVRFGQVLTNLLNNAVKFTESGEIVVTSDSMQDEQGNRWLRVVVEDSGIGISEDIRDSLFEPFTQGDSSIQKRYGGTGLGLAISRTLMKQMQGEIRLLDSTVQGSRFCVLLPVAQMMQDIAPETRVGLKGRKVLVADSHAVSRRAIKNALLYFGMKVFLKPHEREFPELLQQAEESGQPFEVVVIGCRAGELAELERALLERIGNVYRVRILILVSDELVVGSFQEKLRGLNGISVSTKPVRRQRLYDNLMSLLQGRKERVASSPPGPATADDCNATQIKALVGDDNEFSRKLLGTYLTKADITVVEVADGYEAIQQATSESFDIIFLDVHMPDLDGLTVSRAIRENSLNTKTPIVAVTADLFVAGRRQGEVPMITTTLYKPVTRDKLILTLKELLPECCSRKLPASLARPKRERIAEDDAFRRALQAQVEKLNQALAAMQRAEIKSTAHQINGLTGYFGYGDLSASSKELEQMATHAAEVEIETLVRKINEAVGQL